MTSSIRVPDTISKLDPTDSYPIVEGEDVSGFTDLKTEVDAHKSKIEKAIDNVNALDKKGKLHLIQVVGDTPPVFPTEPHGNYVVTVRAMTKRMEMLLPSPLGGMVDGAIFTVFNDDPVDSIMLRPGDPNDKVSGAQGVNVPPDNFATFVYEVASRNFVEIESGYIPAARVNIANYVEQKLDADGKLHTEAEIRAMVSGGGNFLGLTLDDGINNEAAIDTINLKGIDLVTPVDAPVGSSTLDARTSWSTSGEQYGGKANSVIVEPPLEVFDDPNKSDTVRLRVTPGTYEESQAPGYLAYLDSSDLLIGNPNNPTGHRDGAIYPLDVVVGAGSYIQLNPEKKAIGLQEADQGDPNVTGGTDYLVAYRVALQDVAPEDGLVRIYLAEDSPIGDPVSYMKDVNGDLMMVERHYQAGEKLGSLEIIGIINAKGLINFTMHVVTTIADGVLLEERAYGISGIMVQALTPKHKTGMALIQYEIDTQQNIEFTRTYLGPERMSLKWTLTSDAPITRYSANHGQMYNHGTSFYTINDVEAGVIDNQMVIQSVDGIAADFFVGKIFNSEETRALHNLPVVVSSTLTNQNAGFNVSLVKWLGAPDKFPYEIYKSRTNGSPDLAEGWKLVDTLFIAEDVSAENTQHTKTFTVPDDANNYGVIIYPAEAESPLKVSISEFKLDVADPFYIYLMHESQKLDEIHLKDSKQYFESQQDNEGYVSLRYTIGNSADGDAMPCGKHVKGAAEVSIDPTVNQVAGSQAKGGEGALKFDVEGKARVNTKLNLFSDKSPEQEHDVTFWWSFVKPNGSFEKIPDSEITFKVKGGSHLQPNMPEFTVDVEKGTRLALRANSDVPDGAYIESMAISKPSVTVKVNLESLSDSSYEDSWSDIDLSQFDNVYPSMLTAIKDFINASSITFNMDIPDTDHLVVLGAIKELPDLSVRPVAKLDWSYSNTDKTLKVSFGETVGIGRVTIGVFR